MLTIPPNFASVLVVEDERIVATDLQQTLGELGYDAYAVAASSDEAIAVCARQRPDLVLMDIRIQGKQDGVETAGILREQFNVPVVYLTAHADDATIERAKETEPHGYLLKPVSAAELRSTIEVALYRHELEGTLKERERWFATTLRSIADAVVSVDLDGRVTFMNDAAESLCGLSAKECTGRPVRDVLRVLDPRTARPSETPLETALQVRGPVAFDEATLINAKTGAMRAISESAAPVVDRGRVLGAVMVFRDVTERKMLQSQLEVADRLASLGTMAAGVAHEVNNPLAVVTGNAGYVSARLSELRAALERMGGEGRTLAADTDDLVESISDIESAAGRIQRIVGDLRSFARPSPKPGGYADVRAAVNWAVRTTAHEFKHCAQLVVDVGANVPAVAGDEVKLGQVLVNLLINAAQAIPPGHAAENEVRISARVEDGDLGRVVVTVRDTGPGIPAEILPRIFEPFFTTKPAGLGTGLGLSICHGIVTGMGGEITVESGRGRGAAFHLTLPAAPTPQGEEPTIAVPVSPRARARVLAVDDEELVLRILRRALRDHDVVCVQSGAEALARIQAGETFDVVLSDLMMPEMTGMQLYERLLSVAPSVARRVVFMSGGIITPSVEGFLRSVPNPRLDKPFDMHALLTLVQWLAALRDE